jgi:hypothetical protein
MIKEKSQAAFAEFKTFTYGSTNDRMAVLAVSGHKGTEVL